MWMDHRAKEEAEFINSQNHPVLKTVGGSISVEMQTPKLLWIKKNLPQAWSQAKHFFDLSDFLTWKATKGSLVRSHCSLVCKWTFNGESKTSEWSGSYFKEIGLEDLIHEGFAKIGSEVKSPGHKVGYLDKSVAKMMSLNVDHHIPVAAALIDAHAGALGMLAIKEAAELRGDIQNQLGIIAGTSTCHMILKDEPVNIKGVWGPYISAVLSDMWLHEGGQSAVGVLLDLVIESHPAYLVAKQAAQEKGLAIQAYLHEILKEMDEGKPLAELTRDLHVWPDYHGNRCPIADPNIKGMICGLTMDISVKDMALKFLATIQALAYGTRQIMDQLKG